MIFGIQTHNIGTAGICNNDVDVQRCSPSNALCITALPGKRSQFIHVCTLYSHVYTLYH